MKCSKCKFFIKSKMLGNHCGCMGIKPCAVEYNRNMHAKLNKKRKEKYKD